MESMSSLQASFARPSIQQLLGDVENGRWLSKVVIIGHRGVGKNIVSGNPHTEEQRHSVMENTIVSFNMAASQGAKFVEFDVQVTKDGHPIIFHDDFIVTEDKEKNCLVHQRIGDLMLEEFLQIGFQADSDKVGKRLYRQRSDGLFSGWTVAVDGSLCTLVDALEQVPISVGFDVELKFDDYNTISHQELKRSIDAVVQVVKNHSGMRKIFFSSFHPDAALMLRQEQSVHPVLFITKGVPDIYPDVRRGSLAAAMEVCLTGNLQGIVAEVDAILRHPEAVEQFNSAGLTVLTYGDLNNVGEVLNLQARLGIDALIVDHVLEMVEESFKDDKGNVAYRALISDPLVKQTAL